MKTRILLSVVLALASANVFAQDAPAPAHLKRNGLPRDNNSMRELSIDDSHLEKWEMLTK